MSMILNANLNETFKCCIPRKKTMDFNNHEYKTNDTKKFIKIKENLLTSHFISDNITLFKYK